ncbi:hypothetical protein B0H14DRAFT_2585113 [Mycena olivaceomarginata]|nr:hypothetical protein B0H14DRAFT_2585113 [Mycena olivaceomarginata]
MIDEDPSNGLAPEPLEDMSSDDEDEADKTEYTKSLQNFVGTSFLPRVVLCLLRLLLIVLVSSVSPAVPMISVNPVSGLVLVPSGSRNPRSLGPCPGGRAVIGGMRHFTQTIVLVENWDAQDDLNDADMLDDWECRSLLSCTGIPESLTPLPERWVQSESSRPGDASHLLAHQSSAAQEVVCIEPYLDCGIPLGVVSELPISGGSSVANAVDANGGLASAGSAGDAEKSDAEVVEVGPVVLGRGKRKKVGNTRYDASLWEGH